MPEELLSFQEARKQYGVWRWRIELDPAVRFGQSWADIGACADTESAKIRLLDVAWAEAAFMRAYNVLLEDCWRTQSARNEGVPAMMTVLSGAYFDSLERLLTTSLWMDLGDVLIAYRTLTERVKKCKRHVLTPQEIASQVKTLQQRRLPLLSDEPVTLVAGHILHASWDPVGQQPLTVQIVWKPTEPPTVDFAEGPFLESLADLVADTRQQVADFLARALAKPT